VHDTEENILISARVQDRETRYKYILFTWKEAIIPNILFWLEYSMMISINGSKYKFISKITFGKPVAP
jgi:hypothetical protein